jgi:hypothetical protein
MNDQQDDTGDDKDDFGSRLLEMMAGLETIMAGLPAIPQAEDPTPEERELIDTGVPRKGIE